MLGIKFNGVIFLLTIRFNKFQKKNFYRYYQWKIYLYVLSRQIIKSTLLIANVSALLIIKMYEKKFKNFLSIDKNHNLYYKFA